MLICLVGYYCYVRLGVYSTLHPQNIRCKHAISNNNLNSHPHYPVLFDPQTSGGLLFTVPALYSCEILELLKTSGYQDAVIIGNIVSRNVKNSSQDMIALEY